MVPARALIVALLLVSALAGCQREPARPAGTDAAARAARLAFERGEAPWRARRIADLTASDGWTTLVGLHWIEPGPHYVGSAPDNGIRLAVGPAQLGMIDLRAARIRFVPHRGGALTLDGSPLRGAVTLRTDDAPEGPGVIGFDGGRGQAFVIRRGDRHALRVRHADAPTRTGFAGLDYWPGGPQWVVGARFEPHRPARMLPVTNIVGSVEPTPNPGVVTFTRDGRSFRLEVLGNRDGSFLLAFADATSGHGSFGPGRYLDLPPPDARGRVRLDFNRAYNPPCAFTRFATCPLPPLVNRISLAIRAGEKAYAGRH